jgi:hypothetical protein
VDGGGRELVRDDDLVSIASSGPSSLKERDTRGASRLVDAIKRITGNGVKDEDFVRLDRPRQVEVDYRARTSLEAAISLRDAVRTSPWSRRRVMLYFSNGYAIEPGRDRQASGEALLEDAITACRGRSACTAARWAGW